MKKIFLILLLSASTFVLGCHSESIDTPNGILTNEMLKAAKSFAGTYSTHGGTINLSLNAENQFLVTSTFDLIAPGCGSSVGQLMHVRTLVKNNQLAALDATFQLNRGGCTSILGQTVILHYNKTVLGKNHFELYYLVRQDQKNHRIIRTMTLHKD